MAPRLLPWVAGSALLLAACSGGAQTLGTTRPTAPRPTRGATLTPSTTAPANASPLTPWGSPPVVAPAPLQLTARAYYDGAGPAPEDRANGRPPCLLLLPTGLEAAPVKPVPVGRFNLFGEFVVRWTLAAGHRTGLTLSVLAPGDPSDRYFFASAARVTSFSDGSELRTAPQHPRAVLLRVANQNCEYVLSPGGGLPPTDDEPILLSLRLVFAP